MALAKACYPDLDPAKLSSGFPEFNVDGSKFSDKDFARVSNETRHFATSIADKLDLSSFQCSYDSRGKRVISDEPVPQILAPNQSPRPPTPSTITGSGTPNILPPSRPAVEDEISLSLINWDGPAMLVDKDGRITEGESSVPSTSRAQAAEDPAPEAEAKTTEEPAAV